MRCAKGVAQFSGLARSLLMYYAIPGRGRAWRRFYANWLGAGSLAFDIGAHVGNRTAAMAGTGAQVVAVEASLRLAGVLERLYGRRGNITLMNKAIAAKRGEVKLFSSRRFPTVNTVNRTWKEDVGGHKGFAAVRWEEEESVEAISLDDLVARFGQPDFCKLDIEGNEWEALKGLSKPIAGLSFEYIAAVKEIALGCLKQLETLGKYRFNYFADERPQYASAHWLSGREMAGVVEKLDRDARAGEVVAQLQG